MKKIGKINIGILIPIKFLYIQDLLKSEIHVGGDAKSSSL